MKLKLLGSSVQDPSQREYLTAFLVNKTVAIDAGCLGLWGTPQDQEAVRHVFLTHSHADHTASLPIFVENAWTSSGNSLRIYGSRATLNALQRHIFNDVMWPDFVALSEEMTPFLRLCPLEAEVPQEAKGLTVIPVKVDHVVPTVGYVLRDANGSVIIAGDTGPTTRLWEVAHNTPGLRAIFLEACFPNSMKSLAEVSMHLTPEMFCREVIKMPPGVKVVAMHIKVRYREQVIRELCSLGIPNLEIGECEKEYDF